MKISLLPVSLASILILSTSLSLNVLAKEEKTKTTLAETMDWIKGKIEAYSSYTGTCDNNEALQGKMKVKSIKDCTIIVEEFISKNPGGFSQSKEKTFNLKNINPNKIVVDNNILAGCWYSKETNPYFISLTGNSAKDIHVLKRDYAADRQESYDIATENIFFNDKDIADRSVKAIKYAIKLCKDNEPF